MLTWDNIPGVHGILILDETEAIHELDFGDLASAMSGEVRLDIGLGSWAPSASWCCRTSLAWNNGRGRSCREQLTIPGQIAQVEAGRRHLGHCVLVRAAM